MNRVSSFSSLFRPGFISNRLKLFKLNSSPSCSTFSAPIVQNNFKYSHRRSRYNNTNNGNANASRRSRYHYLLCSTGIAPLLQWFWALGKDDMGVSEDNPLVAENLIEQEIKKSWFHRKYGKYDEATNCLHEALRLSAEQGNEVGITRCYQEFANLYLETENYPKAEELYKVCLGRYVNIHLKDISETAKFKSKEIISISLRLSQVYAKLQEPDKAEVGFQLCMDRQGEVVQDHLRTREESPMKSSLDVHNLSQTERDAVSLYGMVMEAYAHFLLTLPPRFKESLEVEEAEIIMIRCQNLLSDLFGQYHSHTVTVLNNFAMDCLTHGRGHAAAKFMKDVVRKAVMNEELVRFLPGYYCNYAEALFHEGEGAQALENVRTALKLALEGEDEVLIGHCKDMSREIEAAVSGKGKGWIW